MNDVNRLRRRGAVAGLMVLAGAAALVAAPAAADQLPDGYGYELVSPPFSLGQTVGTWTIAPDANGVVLTSPGAMEDAGNAPDLGGAFYARRTDTGWRTVPLIPPASEFPTFMTDSAQGIDYTADGRAALWWVQRREDKNSVRFTPVRADADGNVTVAGPTIDESGPGVVGAPVAASADLRTIVIQSVRRNFATDGAPDTRTSSRMGLYVSRPDNDAPGGFSVRQIAHRAGAAMNIICGVQLGSPRTARGAVSDDGRRIFFSFYGSTSCLTAATNQRVWVRDGDAEPEDLSASLCTINCGAAAPAFFEGASYDGRRVYFSTEQKLLNSDQDDTSRGDLYVHDRGFAVNGRLQNLTASGGTGEGAGVQGVVRVSDDGSYVYFVANGRALAGPNSRGDAPQVGDNNLYVYHRPRSPLTAPATIRFIGGLDAADIDRATQFSLLNAENRPVSTSTDGRFLLFAAFSDLAGEKQPGDAQRDLYRYDAASGELSRIWSTEAAHNGAARGFGIWPNSFGPLEMPANGARQKQRRPQWMISDDGRTVAFSTVERLSPDDVNNKRDVYMWQEQTGAITMLSDGRSVRDLDATGVSRGGDVFFQSDARLVPQHRGGTVASFVARRGGGFAPPPEPSTPCVGDACQGTDAAAPAPFAGVGSSTFVGGGNVMLPGVDAKPARQAKVQVTKLKTVRGGKTQVRVKVPSKGRIRVTGSGLSSTSKVAGKAGTYRLVVTLSRSAQRTLQRRHRVKVGVRVRFAPAQGKSSVVRRSVTFRTATKDSSKASSRSVVSVLSSDVQKGR